MSGSPSPGPGQWAVRSVNTAGQGSKYTTENIKGRPRPAHLTPCTLFVPLSGEMAWRCSVPLSFGLVLLSWGAAVLVCALASLGLTSSFFAVHPFGAPLWTGGVVSERTRRYVIPCPPPPPSLSLNAVPSLRGPRVARIPSPVPPTRS